MNYECYMKKAIEQAKIAYSLDEIPIGCIIVKDDVIIAEACNKRNTMKNALGHAEIEAINKACKVVGDWRLEECTLFVTVEPCSMCAGAILQARIPRVVFGAKNKKAGCCGSILNILNDDRFNHKAEIFEGILEEECALLMTDFFKRKIRKVE